MGEAELSLALETLRGELKRQETVLRMSLAEQRRINQDLQLSLERQAGQVASCLNRLDRLNLKLATYTGGLAALWLALQVVGKALLP